MPQMIALRDGEQFIFDMVAENKWTETYGKRYENEDGDTEWSIVHIVRYLTTADVAEFTAKLSDVGFELV